MGRSTKFIVQGGVIAAIYIALTLVFQPISFGYMQVRISEALCILPFFTPAAVPGLFVGCAISNLLGSQFSIVDMIVGSLATLLSALCTYKIKNQWLAPLPAVLINAVMVGIMLGILLNLPLWLTMLSVLIGQAISCYGIGLPLLLSLKKYGKKLFSGGQRD